MQKRVCLEINCFTIGNFENFLLSIFTFRFVIIKGETGTTHPRFSVRSQKTIIAAK